jgi:hypothetical protein
MAAATTITAVAAVVGALTGAGAAVEQRQRGKRAESKTKKETARRTEEQTKLREEEAEQERQEDAKVKRDQQRQARLAKRQGAAGRKNL